MYWPYWLYLSYCSFWCIKWLVVLGLVVAFFFIPDGGRFAFSKSKNSFVCVNWNSSNRTHTLSLSSCFGLWNDRVVFLHHHSNHSSCGSCPSHGGVPVSIFKSMFICQLGVVWCVFSVGMTSHMNESQLQLVMSFEEQMSVCIHIYVCTCTWTIIS